METDNELKVNGRIDTPEEVLSLIDFSIKQLDRELSKYVHIKDDIDTSIISKAIRSEFIHQAIKAGEDLKIRLPIKDLIANKDIRKQFGLKEDSFLQQEKDRRLQWLKFKNYYLKWAKNLLAEMNKAKLVNKWKWLDVRSIAVCLTKLELDESILEGL